MTDQETVMLIETEQRCKSNTHRIDNLENELKEIQSEQKAIYKIATSVELIAQRVSNIETKVDDTNSNAVQSCTNRGDGALRDAIPGTCGSYGP